MADNAGRAALLRLLLVTGLWFGTQRLLTRYAAFWLPRAWASQLSLELYLIITQGVTLAIGLSLAALLLRPNAKTELGWRRPSAWSLALGACLAPLLFAAASYFAVYLALPTLLEELRRGGVELVRENAGGVGRAMRQSPALVALAWAVLVSPVGEELLFRGAIWGSLQRIVEAVAPERTTSPASLPEQYLKQPLLVMGFRKCSAWVVRGGAATLLSGLAFGLLHWDMPGGQGIIRVTATLCLGLACGVARQASGTVAVPILLHMIFNVLGLAGARRWIVTAAFPTHYMVPSMASVLGLFGGALALALWWFRRRPRA